MKYALAASMMALGLAACGGAGDSAKAEFVKQCVAESGADKATCECQADGVEEAVGSSNFSKMANLAKAGKESEAEAMMAKLATENPEMGMKLMAAMMECAS